MLVSIGRRHCGDECRDCHLPCFPTTIAKHSTREKGLTVDSAKDQQSISQNGTHQRLVPKAIDFSDKVPSAAANDKKSARK